MGMGFRRDFIRAIKVFDYAIKRFDFFLRMRRPRPIVNLLAVGFSLS